MSGERYTVDQLLALADSLRKEGRLTDSADACERVLEQQPNHPGALYLLALVFIERKEFAKARGLIEQAQTAAPRDPGLRNALGNVLLLMGEWDNAEKAYRDVIAAQPKHASAHMNLGVALTQLDRDAEALAAFDAAQALAPREAKIARLKASALERLGRLGEAIEAVNTILAVQPGDIDALQARGVLNSSLRKFEDAIADFSRVVAARPDSAGAYVVLSRALHSAGRTSEAIGALQKARSLEEKPGPLMELASMLLDARRPAEALEAVRRASELGRDDAELRYILGTAEIETGDVRRGEQELRRAVELNPSSSDALNNLGGALRMLGRMDEAHEAIKKALELDPKSATALFNLAITRRVSPGDPNLPLFDAVEAELPGLRPGERVSAHFALGKVRSDVGDHDAAFRHFLAGGDLKRELVQFDEADLMARFDRLMAMPASVFAVTRAGATQSDAPIFIVGMPRSGTTLVEQILASHPQVRSVGETDALDRAARPVLDRFESGVLDYARISDPEMARIGKAYVDEVGAKAPGARKIVDKMPFNFLHLGLIKLALPNARIVHLMRDPLDTCISCFTSLFADGHGYAYNLAELGRVYRKYSEMMAHWRTTLPVNSFLDVQYENVVEDLDAQARRILAYCDLPWDPAVLSFHQGQRVVRTASAAQVREPIYTRSVGRWRVYERHLGPLMAELGSLARI